MITDPTRNRFVIIDNGTIGYYHHHVRKHVEPIPMACGHIADDLIVFLGSVITVMRYSRLRKASSVATVVTDRSGLINALRFFLAGRYTTSRQRAMVLSGMTTGTTPVLVAEDCSVYKADNGLKRHWEAHH